ncbi:MAG: DUF2905 domain-containing protein [Calditrichaeota bacterium]|nr:MAG: DUF2905 domain-containing protein [Calditrichota bacterium]
MQPFGKLLVFLGGALLLLGLLIMFMDKLPPIGRLPGDIIIRRKNFTFYFPIMTLLILNLVLWFIIWLVNRFRG